MSMDLDEITVEGPRVRFRDGESGTMPVSWAQAGLAWLYTERPQVFADMMTSGVLGIARTGRRPR